MPERITLQVARYRPEQESEATFDEYEVPYPRDWVVLDGLNHVKDRLDGTLSYRWSCRMGICGSCGMTVNGEPKLTCATFLADYAPGPGPRRAAAQLSRDSRSGRRHRRLHAEAGARQAMDRPRRGEDGGRGRVSADAGGAGRVQAVQHVHQLHALLLRVPDLRARPAVHRPGGDCAGAALQPRFSRDEGAGERMEILSEHEGIWGCTFVGECTKVCPKHVDPAGAIQRYKLRRHSSR